MKLALTLGDPAGIGPELALQVLARPLPGTTPILVGSAALLQRVAAATGLPCEAPVLSKEDFLTRCPGHPAILDLPLPGLDQLAPGAPTALSGQAAYHWLTEAIDLTQAGKFDAIVTCPLSKEALHLGGHFYDGHTEILVERSGTTRHAMMLSAPEVTATLVTTHIAVSEIAPRLTLERICEVTRLTAAALPLWKDRDRPPRLAILGLNPHAGENGLFGDEEARLIQPAMDLLRAEGLDLVGPLSADTAFIPAIRKDIDGYIAMYHDQGLIPLKTLAFDEAVNITLGLPFIRTSVDHGTAYNLAWQKKAQVTSLYAACEAAQRLARN
ncbi:4-hydroxythreonine-4-phosphate dehydrogenase PdxA [Roseibacillus ishigakijimensis]|uniref:4-hydroxythreonine-4-phosphate dehydrogenase PdxA n=1 Tax=Roseibacillus ishigakijimensis TaxID=454146 RepID=A0A934VKR1_9BACT|nr:4-hydroxythreonine-4-phosphate dehydrogenase PdxA [Roseibacillus ishigakijimensis]MBK1832442.1 4-hydroxythreonine-4-phosphate dehydrogenase PdxA [Roseibacillus ishigakijimensis]